jgi:hypothetical protein
MPRGSAAPERCPKCDTRKWQVLPGEELPGHLAEVFQLYEVPQHQRSDIIRYAFQHPGVAQALREAVPELENVFGKVRRRLKISVDPEEDWVELFGLVLVEDLERAFPRLEEFDRAWFSSVPTDVQLHLNFTVKAEDDYPSV